MQHHGRLIFTGVRDAAPPAFAIGIQDIAHKRRVHRGVDRGVRTDDSGLQYAFACRQLTDRLVRAVSIDDEDMGEAMPCDRYCDLGYIGEARLYIYRERAGE